MPGLPHYDFGDMVRTGTSPAPEDETDLSKVYMRFDMFEALVDGIGGVEVEVSEGEASHMNSYFKLGTSGKADKVEPGENVYLNGYQALCYARIRKLDSDFQRTERQQKIISAIIEKMKGDLTPAGVPKLLETAKSVAMQYFL